MGQKVLVIGSGAREHTIAYTLLKAPSIDEVTVAPGNPGMLKDGIHTTQLSQSNHAALSNFVKNNGYDWVFVGPEVPLIERHRGRFRRRRHQGVRPVQGRRPD